MTEKEPLAPYALVKPGWEGVYTGDQSDDSTDITDIVTSRSMDVKGNVICQWSTWPFDVLGTDWAQWGDEAQYINRMQQVLGPLSDEVRRIRIHIGGLVLCDSGVPVTIDELLSTIGSGVLPREPFGLAAGQVGKAELPDLITVRACKSSNPFCAATWLANLRSTSPRCILMSLVLCIGPTIG